MSQESKDSSDEWELITKEQESNEESEEDGSCSGSSIELLSSDDEVDGTVLQDTSVSESNKSGQFFVLRLRSKDYSAESDSDEKEFLAEPVSSKQESTRSSQSGERSEPELLMPVTTDEDSNDEQLLNDALVKENDQTTRDNAVTEIDIPLENQQNNALSGSDKTFGQNGKQTTKESETEKNISLKDSETSFNNDIVATADHVSKVKADTTFSATGITSHLTDGTQPNENISFPSSLCSSVGEEGMTENNVQLEATKIESVPVLETPMIHSLNDMATSEDGDSSNFSLVDEADCQIEPENMVETTSCEDNKDKPFDDINEQSMTQDKPLPENSNSTSDLNKKIEEASLAKTRKSKWSARLYCAFAIIEVLFLLLTIFFCLTLGFFFGFNQVLPDEYRQSQSLNTADELDMFHNHVDNFHRWKENVDKTSALEVSDLKLLFSYDQKNEQGQKQYLKTGLRDYEKVFSDLLTNLIQKIDEGKKATDDNTKLKVLVNDLRNENANLEDKVVEYGKKKYLLSELEEENLALIKRISDMESQLMEAQDQVYVLQLQVSKLEKRLMTSEYDQYGMSAKELRQKLDESEKEVIKLKNQIVEDVELISWLRKEKDKLTGELVDAERWKQENVDLKTRWGELSVQIQNYKEELRKADARVLSDDHSAADTNTKMKEQEIEINALRVGKQKLHKENSDLINKFSVLEKKYKELQNKRENSEDKHVDNEDDDSEDEGVDIQFDEDNDETDLYTDKTKPDQKEREYPKPDKWTLRKITREKLKKEKQKQKDESGNKDGHKSWADAMNEILNKTKSSMVNVSKQIQETLYEVKNLSQELWKKHEPQVNQILMKTYENVKKNVNKVTEKVGKVAKKIYEKSAKIIQRYKKSRKNRRKRKHRGDFDEHTFTASTGKRGDKSGNRNNDDHENQYNNDKQKHYSSDEKERSYPGFLENELQNLRDSVEYINTLQQFKCSELIDIMEDFQNFKKSDGVHILTRKERNWFFCQKDWFESMVHSKKPYLASDAECIERLVNRQIAAIDFNCCPCLGQYGNNKRTDFCDISNGCSHIEPKQKKKKKSADDDKFVNIEKEIYEDENNHTAEEDVTSTRGNFIYCDPFSQDLDCGDESWYLKRMKERSHLRNYRTSSESDWIFKRASDRDYQRTQPDNWYFNRMDNGQSYEAFQDDNWSDTENWYIKKINDDEKSRHGEL